MINSFSKDFVDHPYLHFPEVPPTGKTLVGLRRLWELNRKALSQIDVNRTVFMDLMNSLRRIKDDPDNTGCPKRNLTFRWVQGWLDTDPPFKGDDLNEEAQYLAHCIFNWTGPLPFLDSFEQGEEDIPATSAPAIRSEPVSSDAWSVLSLTIKGAGELFIGQVINTPLEIEGNVKVSIKGADGDRIYGLSVRSINGSGSPM